MSDSSVDALFFLNSEMSLRWVMTLLHFLWQGCVIGTLAVVAAMLLKHHDATVRYWLNAFALLTCPVCVAVTFSFITVSQSLLEMPVAADNDAVTSNRQIDSNALLPSDMPYPIVTTSTSGFLSSTALDSGTNSSTQDLYANSPAAGFLPDADTELSVASAKWYRMIAAWVTVAYGIGVLCFLLRLSVALWGGHRLRTTSDPLADSALLSLVRDQAQRIGLRLVPVVACCERVAVPTVIGVLRPIVLLPATVMTGLTTDEFSAIVSHEFAHIRRYDLWMNLLQRLIESLLFFHPIVWIWLSTLPEEFASGCVWCVWIDEGTPVYPDSPPFILGG